MSTSYSYSQILRFWIPLAGTWLMMAIEGPLLAALIARMLLAEINLAAYGVAFSFALVAEAPIIMLMSASTALTTGALAYRRLRRFTAVLTLLLTTVMALALVPVFFYWLMEEIIGLTPEIAHRVHLALLVLLPWPGAIGWRRFYQGLLIRTHQTRKVALATLGRVTTMGLVAFVLFRYESMEGAMLAGVALSCGVVAELILTRILAHKAIREMLASGEGEALSYPALSRYYLPLALTPFITLGVHPVVTFFLGKGRMPLESLAVLPVVAALTFVFRAIGLSFQEVAIALLGQDLGAYKKIRNFALLLAATLSGTLLLIALSPLAELWFGRVSGLSPLLTDFARLPLILMALLPATTVLTSFMRALLMGAQMTRPISTATAMEAIMIFAVLYLLLVYTSIVGAVCAAIAYLAGRSLALLWMLWPCRVALRRIAVQERE